MPKLKQSVLTIVIGLALAAGISYASHGQWHGAPANPPLSNAPAPINVSSLTQYKDGALGIGGLFRAYGPAVFDGKIKVGDDAASPAAGAIRWSGSDFEGYDGTQWKSFTLDSTAPPSKVAQVRNKQFLASGAFEAPSGVNKVWVRLQAGGGGGGGGYYTERGLYAPGGGGGGGAFASLREFSVSSGASIPVTVGAGGAGGASPVTNKYGLVSQGTNGQNGGGSSFGSFVSVAGGAGGKIATVASKYLLTVGVGGEIGGQQGKCNTGYGTWSSSCAGSGISQSGGDFMDHYGGNGGGTGGVGASTASQLFCSQGGDNTTICGVGITGVSPAVAGYFPGGGGGGGVFSGGTFVDKGANGAGGFVTVLWCDAGLIPVDGKIESGFCQKP